MTYKKNRDKESEEGELVRIEIDEKDRVRDIYIEREKARKKICETR